MHVRFLYQHMRVCMGAYIHGHMLNKFSSLALAWFAWEGLLACMVAVALWERGSCVPGSSGRTPEG